ncbi:MAG: lipoyl(octanoyl) transferase LipB [Saprospiraceae bacterium]|nr:lipoyl(octanoyl) transferase LipB [Saprospiraceae bacterium]
MIRTLDVLDLGFMSYNEAFELQSYYHKGLISQKRQLDVDHQLVNNTLILVQHPHVFTLGTSGKQEHLKLNQDDLGHIEAQFQKINRGGDITYHGPGQLVAYPILDLDQFFTDVHKYVRYLEEAVIMTIGDFGIKGGRIKDFTGVWVDIESAKPRKICAIGVHLSRWVTLHGLALNVNTDLNYFDYIIPCGIEAEDKSVTSMEKELGKSIEFEQVKEIFIHHLSSLFGTSTKYIKHGIGISKNS